MGGKATFNAGLQVIAVVSGQLTLETADTKVALRAGRYCLVPATVPGFRIHSRPGAAWLHVTEAARPQAKR